MATKNYFTDLDLNFHPNYLDGDVTFKINEEAVKRSLRNLILIRRYEKPFHPEITSGIQDLLFENPNPVIYGNYYNLIAPIKQSNGSCSGIIIFAFSDRVLNEFKSSLQDIIFIISSNLIISIINSLISA